MSVGPEAVEGAEGRSSAQVVAGYLSALAIFTALISLGWHPLRLDPVALLLALVGAGMAGRGRRLALAGVMITAACFFLALSISVLTQRPLW
jgi:hypothetical protein